VPIDIQQFKDYMRHLRDIAENPEVDTTTRTLAMAVLVLDKGLADVEAAVRDQRANLGPVRPEGLAGAPSRGAVHRLALAGALCARCSCARHAVGGAVCGPGQRQDGAVVGHRRGDAGRAVDGATR